MGISCWKKERAPVRGYLGKKIHTILTTGQTTLQGEAESQIMMGQVGGTTP